MTQLMLLLVSAHRAGPGAAPATSGATYPDGC